MVRATKFLVQVETSEMPSVAQFMSVKNWEWEVRFT